MRIETNPTKPSIQNIPTFTRTPRAVGRAPSRTALGSRDIGISHKPHEFPRCAAYHFGGSLYGGRGSVLGSLCGAVIMAVIRSGCDQLEVPNPYQNIIIAAIIIAAVAVDQFRQRRLRT